MRKKSVIFLGVAALIFLLAFYTQLKLMNNDVRTYHYEISSGFGKNQVTENYEVVLMDVSTSSRVYVTYEGEVQGAGHTFRILDPQNKEILSKTGKDIHVFKEKLSLEKGRYQIIIDIDQIESLKRNLSIIYRREEVLFRKLESKTNP